MNGHIMREAYMTPFVVVLGIVGAVLILAGLVGGGFTLSGSFMPGVGMPKIGNWVRLPCFSVGVLLVLTAIGLGFDYSSSTADPSHSPVSVVNTTSTAPTTPSPSDAANVLAAGIIQAPQGDSTIYVYEQPTPSSSVVAEVADGATINILCTAQGDVVTNPDTGQSSSLWDGTSEGYIPDVFVYTGTNQATMGSC
jgi:hypothetical protein